MRLLPTCFAAAAMLTVFTLPSQAGDAEKGAKVYKKCVSCHMIGDGAKNRVGPQLNDMFARGIGALEDYKYSKGMMAYAAEAKVWTEANLDAYSESPRKLVKGGRMSFAGLRKAKDRHNVIAYFKQETQYAISRAPKWSDNWPLPHRPY